MGNPILKKYPVERKPNGPGYYYVLRIEVNGDSYTLQHDTDINVCNLSKVIVNGKQLSGRDKKPAMFKVAEYLGIEVNPKWEPNRVLGTIVMTLWRDQNPK